MSEKLEFLKELTPEFRVAFPQIWVPKSIKGGAPFFTMTALFPKATDISNLKKLASAARDRKWPSYPPAGLRNPFRDGKEKQFDTYLDCVFITMKTKEQPGLIDMKNQKILNPKDFYAGCWARATVTAYAYENMGNVGVAFGLLNIQKVRDDAPISNRASAEDDFGPVNPSTPNANTDNW